MLAQRIDGISHEPIQHVHTADRRQSHKLRLHKGYQQVLPFLPCNSSKRCAFSSRHQVQTHIAGAAVVLSLHPEAQLLNHS